MKLIKLLIPVLAVFLLCSCDKEPTTPVDDQTNPDNYDNTTGLNDDNSKLFDFRDNEVYDVISIGNQMWMAQNLRYEVSGSWYNSSNPSSDYGRLYSWSAIMDGASSSSGNPSMIKGVCPNGWHLPSDAEWSELEEALGMQQVYADSTGYRSNHGTGMKSSSGWYNNGNGTNDSGFNVLPAGICNPLSINALTGLYRDAVFWSATEYSSSRAWYRGFYYTEQGVVRNDGNKEFGFSCRCILD